MTIKLTDLTRTRLKEWSSNSIPAECAAEQTDESSGCCSADRGWSKAATIQPEKGLHPKKTLSAELVPEK